MRIAIANSRKVLIVLSLKEFNRKFCICKLNLEVGEWERVDSLGDEMLIFGIYNSGSKYQDSLNILFRKVRTDDYALTGFMHLSKGRAPDSVTVVFQCRGDSYGSKCRTCADTAVAGIWMGQLSNILIRYEIRSRSTLNIQIFVSFFFFVLFAVSSGPTNGYYGGEKVFDVRNYGARSDGQRTFLRLPPVYTPVGTLFLRQVMSNGPCKSLLRDPDTSKQQGGTLLSMSITSPAENYLMVKDPTLGCLIESLAKRL
ncbi:hypothetical protein Bca52824_010532 [Brassica carinata]|uniref:Gnk2-homologous domain-containing protein n=1 Tax=Brassica carinata TaxID=52824 RepID=A0A8X8B7R7_BRACI|nr:hypothetical protein Bca52824_010532 [Brassica carinata]